MPDIAPLTSNAHNQNCIFDKVKLPERSDALRGKNWGRKNLEVGGRTANYEELAFGLGIIKNYFSSCFDSVENPVLGFIVRALTGGGDFLEGQRDREMYGEAYGHGVDELAKVNANELTSDQNVFNRFEKEEERYGDDYAQNKRQEALYGERIVAKFGEWATQISKIKPVAHFISGILGDNWRTAVQTILDFPARMWWRLRFFTKALHGNFVTSVWDLARFKFMSLFGSNAAAEKYTNKVQELGKMSGKYFENKYKVNKPGDVGLSLYLRMLMDRMTEHWEAIWNPQAALERKSNSENGFLERTSEKEREVDSHKTFNNGFVDPNSENDKREQRRLALVDFTGPICAALGLIGTVVFDPLKIIWGVAGIEKGKGLINALSASRKSFSLINYIFRFIIPEMHEGAKYKELEKHMNSEEGPSEEIKEKYYARKSRYHNALLGIAVAVGNICEPLLHLKRGIIGDSKFGNFLIDTIIRFNDTFFLRFFSKRRETQGKEYDVEGLPVLSSKQEGFMDKFIVGVTGAYEKVKDAFSGKSVYMSSSKVA